MRRAFPLALLFLLAACVYSAPRPIYYEENYLQPLPASLEVESPKHVSIPPPEMAKLAQPLPPVLVIPGRNLYLYNELYYYRWEHEWFFSKDRTGPWYLLKPDYYPPEKETQRPPTPFQLINPHTPLEPHPLPPAPP
jgi:hypothetical protein